MPQQRRLQVFISSTFEDLKLERQAAVEAILSAGHIPAGMELFAAGDESQLEVIRRWIDESDVYLLILGGRYGSVDRASGKSYTQIEYEYALSKKKPLFAVVITNEHLEQKVKSIGSAVIERDEPQKLKDFRAIVLSHIVKFWSDPRDIKLAVMETLNELSRRAELVGWVPGSAAVNVAPLADEIARLTKENAELRETVARLGKAGPTFNGLSFDEMSKLLAGETLSLEDVDPQSAQPLTATAAALGRTAPSLLDYLWLVRETLNQENVMKNWNWLGSMQRYGLVEHMGASEWQFTDSGRAFMLRMRVEKGNETLNKLFYGDGG